MGKLKSAVLNEQVRTPISIGREAAAPARSASEDGRGGAALDAPPRTNRGETEIAPLASLESMQIVLSDGEIKTVLVRRPVNGQVAMIDTLRFTIGEETWSETAGIPLVTDEAFVNEACRHLTQIFGFGVTADLGKSRDFYLNAWVLGDNYGHIALGGQRQRSTMLISLTGQGCIAAKPGWEHRLHAFMVDVARRPSITRIDLAHDCHPGRILRRSGRPMV